MMWSPWAITLSILFIYGYDGAPLSNCPKSCTCIATELYCSSFNFLETLTDDEASAITKLVVNNSTARKAPKLNRLYNLKTLNLSHNKLKQFNSLHFPKTVEYLDLSYNFITNLPSDLHTNLRSLSELRLYGNPISCTCDSISIRDQLLKNKVVIAPPVKCHSPENVLGKSWLTVSCVHDLFGEMQGDAPYEGSGFEEVITESDIESKNQDKSLEEEFIRVESDTQSSKPSVNKSPVEDEEGSGSSDNTTPLIQVEDDDYKNEEDNEDEIPLVTEPYVPSVRVNDLLLDNVKACNFDCSTPSPPENETDSLPPPSVFEGVKIVWDDFSILKESNATTTSTTSELPITIQPHETSKNISKESDTELLTKEVAEVQKGNITEEANQSSSSTYIFLGALLLLIIALVMYAIVKKRASKRRTLSPNKADEEAATKNEVELLKATKPSNGTHEIVPLVNGHGGDNDTNVFEDVELRQKPNDVEEEHANLLTPETKRVTIKASEIPNSTPKTPILVTRHLNSDGSIVTTPTVHQKV